MLMPIPGPSPASATSPPMSISTRSAEPPRGAGVRVLGPVAAGRLAGRDGHRRRAPRRWPARRRTDARRSTRRETGWSRRTRWARLFKVMALVGSGLAGSGGLRMIASIATPAPDDAAVLADLRRAKLRRDVRPSLQAGGSRRLPRAAQRGGLARRAARRRASRSASPKRTASRSPSPRSGRPACRSSRAAPGARAPPALRARALAGRGHRPRADGLGDRPGPASAGAEDLYLSVFVDNHRARRFYERYGFTYRRHLRLHGRRAMPTRTRSCA